MKNINIVKKNYEFQKIISSRKKVKSQSFAIFFQKNNLKGFKYGISVGKKIGNAVLRNRIKRQIRAMIFELLDLYKNKNFNIIIIVRKEYLNGSYLFNLNELKKVMLLIK